MKPGLDQTAKQWADKIRSLHRSSEKKWPVISIWHSDADRVVAPSNARELVEQWTNLHQIETAPQIERHEDYTLHRYLDRDGNTAITLYLLEDIDHGQPIKRGGRFSKEHVDDCGEKGRYMIDSSLCASYHIARSWRLIPNNY